MINFDLKILQSHNNLIGQDTMTCQHNYCATLTFPYLMFFLSPCVCFFQSMTDKFQKEISTAMRSKNNAVTDCQLLLMGQSMTFSTTNLLFLCVSYLLVFSQINLQERCLF